MLFQLRTAFAALLCLPVTTVFAVPSLNLREALADTKAKLAGGHQVNILAMGDSLTMRPGAYLPYFTQRMQNHYGNGGAGYQSFSIWSGGGYHGDWVWNTVNQDLVPHHSLDGMWMSTTQHEATAFLTAQEQTIELQYLAQPGGGTFRPFHWEVPGFWLGDPISAESATPEVRTWTYKLSAQIPDNRVWYMTQGTGTVTLLGQTYQNDSPGVRVHRAANGGWQVANFLQRDSTFDDQVELLNPDLVMIMLGANDAGGTTGPQFKSNMNQLLDRLWSSVPNADVVLISPFDLSAVDDPDDHIYQRVVIPDEQIAAERGVGFINLHEVAGEYESVWLANGYLDDGVHTSPAGGEYLANILYNAFLTDAQSPRWRGATVDSFVPGHPPASSIPEPAALAWGIISLAIACRPQSRAKR